MTKLDVRNFLRTNSWQKKIILLAFSNLQYYMWMWMLELTFTPVIPAAESDTWSHKWMHVVILNGAKHRVHGKFQLRMPGFFSEFLLCQKTQIARDVWCVYSRKVYVRQVHRLTRIIVYCAISFWIKVCCQLLFKNITYGMLRQIRHFCSSTHRGNRVKNATPPFSTDFFTVQR